MASAPPGHGPWLHGDDTVTFRVWAPNRRRVSVVADSHETPMAAAGRGWYHARVPATDGTRYGFRLDGGPPRPDPASRRQPDGVHGLSAVVDPARFRWSPGEERWCAPALASGAVYELHVGTFTEEGTLAAAAGHLPALGDLGVSHVEVMPLNGFNGVHGWGYDGVAWFAVHEPYGGPHGFAAFVDACHRAGLAVVLDVVHNHLGPSGNYLPEFGPYLRGGEGTGWGQAINLDGPGSDAVRGLLVANTLSWLVDYHVDALRLDAVHALVDRSAVHVLAEIADAVAALEARSGRRLELVAESDRNDPQTVRPRAVGGLGLDAQWADDLHHALHTAITGEDEGYYTDYAGLTDVARAYTHGFVHDGSRYSLHRQRTVGAPLCDVPGYRLVGALQNHDQVGNRAGGERLTVLAEPGLVRAAVVLLCAAPHTPMLFMGEEYGETNPFLFFSSHPEPDLAEAVRVGRREEFAAFTAFAGDVPDPQDPATFAASRLDRSRADTDEGRARRLLWGDLLAARRAHPALGNGRRDLVSLARVGATEMLAVRADPAGDRVAVTANLAPGPTVLAAPQAGTDGAGAWEPLVDTGQRRYGGDGTVARVAATGSGWAFHLPARSAALWAPA